MCNAILLLPTLFCAPDLDGAKWNRKGTLPENTKSHGQPIIVFAANFWHFLTDPYHIILLATHRMISPWYFHVVQFVRYIIDNLYEFTKHTYVIICIYIYLSCPVIAKKNTDAWCSTWGGRTIHGGRPRSCRIRFRRTGGGSGGSGGTGGSQGDMAYYGDGGMGKSIHFGQPELEC